MCPAGSTQGGGAQQRTAMSSPRQRVSRQDARQSEGEAPARTLSAVKVATFGSYAPGGVLEGGGRPVTINVPSRYIPVMGVVLASVTIFGSVGLNRYYGHDIGGIPWPYISDTAKDPPQSGLFAYGLTVVSSLIGVIVVINYSKISIDLDLSRQNSEATSKGVPARSDACAGRSRNQLALVSGLVAAPNLGLLGCFDTQRSPDAHLLFVLLFFIPCVVHLYAVKSVYELLLSRAEVARKQGKTHEDARAFKSYTSLRTSLLWKRVICNVFLVAVTLYLPVGMYMVSDWVDYSRDVAVHTGRAVAQHVSVLSLCAFFGSMYFDFGDLEFIVVQG